MKKTLLILSAIATLFAFVSCGGGAEPDGPAKSDNVPENGGGNTPTEFVIFDPATLESAPIGEIVEKDGAKYLKITVDGYNTLYDIPEIDCSGKTTFKATVYAEEASSSYQLVVKLTDKDGGEISTPTLSDLATTPSEISAGISVKQDWNTISETMKCAKIQVYVQEKSGSYPAQKDKVVYIGKVIAE